ncbi:hypothetical protein [Fulvimarina sp. MAC3]|uniref:hypothetical protein n=1 Tax=Fulvimarina sp. MAC3 TaxID=3148887 RepID=UPI0031FBF29C
MKSLRIATMIAGVSAFAIPALAQTEPEILPGSETATEQQAVESREDTAAMPGSETDAPVADPASETMVPGSETGETENMEMQRDMTAEQPGGGEEMQTNDGPLVPGSGATFAPGENATGEDAALQDESVTSPQ